MRTILSPADATLPRPREALRLLRIWDALHRAITAARRDQGLRAWPSAPGEAAHQVLRQVYGDRLLRPGSSA